MTIFNGAKVYTLSCAFGSSRTNPSDGPPQPFERITRTARSELLVLRYSSYFSLAPSETFTMSPPEGCLLIR